jgi:hypothetical protein
VKLDVKYLPDEVFIQADWDQADDTAIDFIKHKPLDRILPKLDDDNDENNNKILILQNS